MDNYNLDAQAEMSTTIDKPYYTPSSQMQGLIKNRKDLEKLKEDNKDKFSWQQNQQIDTQIAQIDEALDKYGYHDNPSLEKQEQYKGKTLDEIMQSYTYMSKQEFRELIANLPEEEKAKYEDYSPLSRINKQVKGFALLDQKKIDEAYNYYFNPIDPNSRETLLNTTRTDNGSNSNWFTKQLLDLGIGAGEVISDTFINPYYKIKSTLDFYKMHNLGSYEAIKKYENKQALKARALDSLREARNDFFKAQTNGSSLEDLNNLDNKIKHFEDLVHKYDDTEEDLALKDSADFKQYTALKKNILENDKSQQNVTEAFTTDWASWIDPSIKPSNETYNQLVNDIGQRALSEKERMLGTNYSILEKFWDQTKLSFETTSVGRGVGVIVPFAFTSGFGKGINVAVNMLSLSASKYGDAIRELESSNKLDNQKFITSMLYSTGSAFVDFYGTDKVLGSGKDLFTKKFRKNTDKYAALVTDKVEKTMSKSGLNNLPNAGRLRQTAILDTMAAEGKGFEESLIRDLVRENDGTLDGIINFLTHSNSHLSNIAGQTAKLVKGSGVVNDSLHRFGVGVQDWARAMGGLAAENVGSAALQEMAEGATLQDFADGKFTNELIKNAAEGVVTGGLSHAPLTGGYLAKGAIDRALDQPKMYNAAKSKAVENLVNKENLTNEEFHLINGLNTTTSQNISALQNRIDSAVKTFNEKILGDKQMINMLGGKQAEVQFNKDTGEVEFKDADSLGDIAPEASKHLDRALKNINNRTKYDREQYLNNIKNQNIINNALEARDAKEFYNNLVEISVDYYNQHSAKVTPSMMLEYAGSARERFLQMNENQAKQIALKVSNSKAKSEADLSPEELTNYSRLMEMYNANINANNDKIDNPFGLQTNDAELREDATAVVDNLGLDKTNLKELSEDQLKQLVDTDFNNLEDSEVENITKNGFLKGTNLGKLITPKLLEEKSLNTVFGEDNADLDLLLSNRHARKRFIEKGGIIDQILTKNGITENNNKYQDYKDYILGKTVDEATLKSMQKTVEVDEDVAEAVKAYVAEHNESMRDSSYDGLKTSGHTKLAKTADIDDEVSKLNEQFKAKEDKVTKKKVDVSNYVEAKANKLTGTITVRRKGRVKFATVDKAQNTLNELTEAYKDNKSSTDIKSIVDANKANLAKAKADIEAIRADLKLTKYDTDDSTHYNNLKYLDNLEQSLQGASVAKQQAIVNKVSAALAYYKNKYTYKERSALEAVGMDVLSLQGYSFNTPFSKILNKQAQIKKALEDKSQKDAQNKADEQMLKETKYIQNIIENSKDEIGFAKSFMRRIPKVLVMTGNNGVLDGTKGLQRLVEINNAKAYPEMFPELVKKYGRKLDLDPNTGELKTTYSADNIKDIDATYLKNEFKWKVPLKVRTELDDIMRLAQYKKRVEPENSKYWLEVINSVTTVRELFSTLGVEYVDDATTAEVPTITAALQRGEPDFTTGITFLLEKLNEKNAIDSAVAVAKQRALTEESLGVMYSSFGGTMPMVGSLGIQGTAFIEREAYKLFQYTLATEPSGNAENAAIRGDITYKNAIDKLVGDFERSLSLLVGNGTDSVPLRSDLSKVSLVRKLITETKEDSSLRSLLNTALSEGLSLSDILSTVSKENRVTVVGELLQCPTILRALNLLPTTDSLEAKRDKNEKITNQDILDIDENIATINADYWNGSKHEFGKNFDEQLNIIRDVLCPSGDSNSIKSSIKYFILSNLLKSKSNLGNTYTSVILNDAILSAAPTLDKRMYEGTRKYDNGSTEKAKGLIIKYWIENEVSNVVGSLTDREIQIPKTKIRLSKFKKWIDSIDIDNDSYFKAYLSQNNILDDFRDINVRDYYKNYTTSEDIAISYYNANLNAFKYDPNVLKLKGIQKAADKYKGKVPYKIEDFKAYSTLLSNYNLLINFSIELMQNASRLDDATYYNQYNPAELVGLRSEEGSYSAETVQNYIQKAIIVHPKLSQYIDSDGIRSFIKGIKPNNPELESYYADNMPDGAEVLDKILKEYTKQGSSKFDIYNYGITPTEANNLGKLLFGLDANSRSLVADLGLPTSKSISTKSNGVKTTSKLTNRHEVNILKSVYGKDIKDSCMGADMTFGEIQDYINNQDLINIGKRGVDIMSMGTLSNPKLFSTLRELGKGYFDESIYKTVMFTSLGLMPQLIEPNQSKDFLNKLPNVEVQQYYSDKHLHDTTTLRKQLGQEAFMALGFRIKNESVRNAVINDLGDMAICTLTTLGLLHLEYVGADASTGNLKVVQTWEDGANKKNLPLTASFTKESKPYAAAVTKLTYNVGTSEHNILKDMFSTNRNTYDDFRTAKSLKDEQTQLKTDFSTTHAKIKHKTITFNNKNGDKKYSFNIEENTAEDILKLTMSAEDYKKFTYHEGVDNKDLPGIVVTKNGKDYVEVYVDRHNYYKPDSTRYSDKRILECMLDSHTKRNFRYDEYMGIMKPVIEDSKLTKEQAINSLTEDLDDSNVQSKYTAAQLQALKDIRVLLKDFEPINLTGVARDNAKSKFAAEIAKMYDDYAYAISHEKQLKEGVYFNQINTVNNRVYVEARYLNYRESSYLRSFWYIDDSKSTLRNPQSKGLTDFHKLTLLANFGYDFDKMLKGEIDEPFDILADALEKGINTVLAKKQALLNINSYQEMLKEANLVIEAYNKGKPEDKQVDLIKYSIESLSAMSKLIRAKKLTTKSIKDSFNSWKLTVEIDGLTNGVALQKLREKGITVSSKFLKAIGLYINVDETAAYFMPYKKEIDDAYLTNRGNSAALIHQALIQDIIQAGNEGDIFTLEVLNLMASIYIPDMDYSKMSPEEIIKACISRNFMKYPTMAINYGSGKAATHKGLCNILMTESSKLLFDVATGKNAKESRKNLTSFLELACKLNNSMTIALATPSGKQIKVDKFGKIHDSSLGYEDIFAENFKENLLDYCLDFSVAANAKISEEIDKGLSSKVFDGIGIVQHQINTTGEILTKDAEIIDNTICALLEQQITKVIDEFNKQDKVGKIDEIKALDSVVNQIKDNFKSVLSIGEDGTTLDLLKRSKITDENVKNIISSVIMFDNNKIIYKTHAVNLGFESAGSAISPELTHTSDGNIIQALKLATITEGIHFLGIHDAIEILPDFAEDAATMMNEETFKETFLGNLKTLKSAAEDMDLVYQIAERNKLNVAEVLEGKKTTEEHKFQVAFDHVNLLREMYKLQTSSKKDSYLVQYQLLPESGYPITTDAIKDMLKAISNEYLGKTTASVRILDTVKRAIAQLPNQRIKEIFLDTSLNKASAEWQPGLAERFTTSDTIADTFKSILEDVTRNDSSLSQDDIDKATKEIERVVKEQLSNITENDIGYQILAKFVKDNTSYTTLGNISNNTTTQKVVTNIYNTFKESMKVFNIPFTDEGALNEKFAKIVIANKSLLQDVTIPIQVKSLLIINALKADSNYIPTEEVELIRKMTNNFTNLKSNSFGSVSSLNKFYSDPNTFKPKKLDVDEELIFLDENIDCKQLLKELDRQILESRKKNTWLGGTSQPDTIIAKYSEALRSKYRDMLRNKKATVVLTSRGEGSTLIQLMLASLKASNSAFKDITVVLANDIVTPSSNSISNRPQLSKVNKNIAHVQAIEKAFQDVNPDRPLNTKYILNIGQNRYKDSDYIYYLTGKSIDAIDIVNDVRDSKNSTAKSNVKGVGDNKGRLYYSFEGEFEGDGKVIPKTTSYNGEGHKPGQSITINRNNADYSRVKQIDRFSIEDTYTAPKIDDTEAIDLANLKMEEAGGKSYLDLTADEKSDIIGKLTKNTTKANVANYFGMTGRIYADITKSDGIYCTNNGLDFLDTSTGEAKTYMVRTSTSGRILDAKVASLFGSKGMNEFRAIGEEYYRIVNARLSNPNLTIEQIKAPVIIKRSNFSFGDISVVFVPFKDDIMDINTLRNSVTRKFSEHTKQAFYSYNAEFGANLNDIFNESVLNQNQDTIKALYDITTSSYEAKKRFISRKDLEGKLPVGVWNNQASMEATTANISGDSIVIASQLVKDMGIDISRIIHLDSYHYDTNSNYQGETVTSLSKFDAKAEEVYVNFANTAGVVLTRLLDAKDKAVSAWKNAKFRNPSKTGEVKTDEATHGYSSISENHPELKECSKLTKEQLKEKIDKFTERDEAEGRDISHLRELIDMLYGFAQKIKLHSDFSHGEASWSTSRGSTTYVKLGFLTGPHGSNTEVALHEMLIHPVMNYMDTNASIQKQAGKVFDYVINNLTADMFEDVEYGQSVLDYIKSKAEKGDRNEAIGELFAYAMTNKETRDAISNINARINNEDNIFSRIKGVVRKILHLDNTSIPSDSLGFVDTTFRQIYREANAMAQENLRIDAQEGINPLDIEDTVNIKLYDIFREFTSKFDSLKGLGVFADTISGVNTFEKVTGKQLDDNTTAEQFINFLQKYTESIEVTDQVMQKVKDFLGEYLMNLKGNNKDAWEYTKLRLACKQGVDLVRNKTASYINEQVEKFLENVPVKVKNQLTSHLIRTDISCLFEGNKYTPEEVEKIMKNKAYRQKAIETVSNRLRNYKQGNYLVNASKGLADYMTEGVNTSGLGYKNAWEIANMSGMINVANRPTTAESDVDTLATLIAIDNIASRENSVYKDIDISVVENLSKLHNTLKQTEREADYQTASTIHHLSKGKVEGGKAIGQLKVYDASYQKALEWAGSPGSKLTPTKLDPFFKQRNAQFLTAYFPFRSSIPIDGGVFALADIYQGRVTKGIQVDHRAIDKNYMYATNIGTITSYLTARFNNLNSSKPVFINPKEVDGAISLHYDETGALSGANFELNEIQASKMTGRHYKITSVLGDIGGSTVERKFTVVNNNIACKAIADIYESRNNKDEFTWISPTSEDAELRQEWSNLPPMVKDFFTNKYGDAGMPVLKGNIQHVVGRRQTTSKVIDKEYYQTQEAARTLQQKMLHYFRNGLVNIAEDGIRYLTAVGKENLVIKSMSVAVNNYISNYLLLINQGVNPVKALTDQIEGLEQVADYRKLQNEIDKLKGKALTTPLNQAETTKLKSLYARLEGMPLNVLAENGLLGTVTEDLQNSDNLIKNLIDTYLPTNVAKIVHEATLDQSSKIYQVLRDFVTVGDYIGKYALYKNLPKQMPLQEKLKNCQNAFIDYGMNLPKGLDYIENLGIINFMKYSNGIQKVILDSTLKSPSRALATYLGARMLSSEVMYTPTMFDSFLGLGTLNRGLNVPGVEIFMSGIENNPYITLFGAL